MTYYSNGNPQMPSPQDEAWRRQTDINQNKGMGVLAYIGILVLIPLFARKNSPFARYHTNQGLVLFIVGLIIAAARSLLLAPFPSSSAAASAINVIFALISLAQLVLMILGIVHAAQGKFEPLPVIGGITVLK